MDIIARLSEEFQIARSRVESTVQLIDEGNTIPFIARYRKEITGSLDDQVLRELYERLTYLRNLEARKQEVIASIESQGVLTEEIAKAVSDAQTLAEVEDLYRPFKPKRKTRASVAKEKGLQLLADFLLEQQPRCMEPLKKAEEFIDPEKGVENAGDALNGAKDIVAEAISDDAEVRKILRAYLMKEAKIESKSEKAADTVYAMYADYSEPVAKIPGHRILAIDRGEKEDVLKIAVVCDSAWPLAAIYARYVKKNNSPCCEEVRAAAEDAYSRLIFPSLEREIRNMLTEKACDQAIKVFSLNLRNLLMQPPVKGNVALGLDPGYRTGCKVAVVDQTGKVLDTGVIYPTHSQSKKDEAAAKVKSLIQKYGVTVIAIGNGTASKETEMFTAEVLKGIPGKVSYMVVSEAGASVYSASKLAAEEFPEYDVSLRSAVSIARRLQDPLAELVKIDPRAVGVGQYQHDMPKAQLSDALTGVVESCVNSVGVDLNTASHSLLSYVAGINGTVAKNIVAYREGQGAFSSRKELLKVPKLGKKAFEQCAGFLRVPESDNLLDHTAVHPESYKAAEDLLSLCGYSKKDIKETSLADLSARAAALGYVKAAGQIGVGEPTLRDIISELTKPGRDPRDELPKPMLRTDVLDLKDLKPGMELTGTVRNVIDFGAFVDIGVHEDGLVHISQLCDRYVKHPSEVVKVGDIVKVWVLSVDEKRGRIGLTMKGSPAGQGKAN